MKSAARTAACVGIPNEPEHGDEPNTSGSAVMNQTSLAQVRRGELWQGEGMNQTRPKSSRAVLHGRTPFPGLLPLHDRRRSEHTHTQIKSTNKIYLCAHTHTHTVADEDDEGGGRRGWPEVISRRRGCDGDDDERSDKGDDDERSGEGDDERTARRASVWNRGQRVL